MAEDFMGWTDWVHHTYVQSVTLIMLASPYNVSHPLESRDSVCLLSELATGRDGRDLKLVPR